MYVGKSHMDAIWGAMLRNGLVHPPCALQGVSDGKIFYERRLNDRDQKLYYNLWFRPLFASMHIQHHVVEQRLMHNL